MGVKDPVWSYSVFDTARVTRLVSQVFVPTPSGADPTNTTLTAQLPLGPLAQSGGLFLFTVSVTTEGGVSTTPAAGPVGLGMPAAPDANMTARDSPAGLTLLVTSPQRVTVTVPASFYDSGAKAGQPGTKAVDVTGTTAAIRPNRFIITVV